MMTKTEAYPDVAIPPGEYLAEEIQVRGISQQVDQIATSLIKTRCDTERWFVKLLQAPR